MLTAVDLAAKMSAAVDMDDDGNVIDQYDSWRMSENEFLDRIVSRFVGERPYDVLVIEDLPFRLPFMTLVKNVCRIQGRIEEKLIQANQRDKALWVPPATWLRSYGIKTAKGAAALVQPKAEELGYTVPIDYTLFKGKERTAARKSNTDYSSAYLIARWATNYYKEHGTYDAPTTQRFK